MIANPILNKELFIRMRHTHQPLPQRIGIGLVIAILLAFIYYETITSLNRSHSPSDGYALWAGTMLVQSIFILLITPVAATNAITKEREQRTWEMLVFTRLTPAEIILGKLAGRMFSTFLVLIIGLPVALISTWYADLAHSVSSEYISLSRFCIVYLTQIIMGLFFTTFGLFMSLLVKRTLYAVMASYTFVIGVLLVATLFITVILSTLLGNYDFMTRCPLMWFNPGMMITNMLSNDSWGTTAPQGSYSGTLYLAYGLVGYALLTGLMIWRMIACFRKYAYEG